MVGADLNGFIKSHITGASWKITIPSMKGAGIAEWLRVSFWSCRSAVRSNPGEGSEKSSSFFFIVFEWQRWKIVNLRKFETWVFDLRGP